MHAHLPQALAHIDAALDDARSRWFDLLRIPSVSAQPAHAADCRAAAEHLRDALLGLGFTAALHETPGHPVLLARHAGPPGTTAPRALYYGHYDVQPAEPLELWTSPPFEPHLVHGPHGPQVVARGAVDDKGQVSLWLEALRAWHATIGTPPIPVTILIEGEEEVGSPNLEPFLVAHRAALAADLCIISDTNMWDVDTPALTTRLRGLCYLQLTLRAASRDLHSGLYGGSALNPINALTRILGDLHAPDGRIRLPGFYDHVQDTPPDLAAQWHALAFDEPAFLADIGLHHPAGEHGRPPLERLWNRPTADINGIWGGYDGPGAKTVIASEAGAKVSFRLVPGQDPAAVMAAFQAFVDARLPPGATARIESFGLAPGVEIPAHSPWVQAARQALADEYGRPAILMGSGGSIPVVESMHRLLGLESLLMGFGLPDDQVHSPNEKFDWRCFHQGIRAHTRLLAQLAGPAATSSPDLSRGPTPAPAVRP